MKYLSILLVLFVFSSEIYAQELTGQELLDKTIAYHDPDGNWSSFNEEIQVNMQTPDSPTRYSHIKINLLEEHFNLVARKDTMIATYSITKGKCETNLPVDPKAKRTPCETAALYKDYYTYLYGLPMKLKDPGTHIGSRVEKKNFKGKDYLVLKVTYDETVGSDVWFFYFDPTTYAMEIYQFYKGDPNGKGKDTGEYILLTEEIVIDGIKMPKNRSWYYNKDDKYLGTDMLKVK